MPKKDEYEFAIKREVLASDEVLYTPVTRIKSKFKISSNKWERITKIYNKYYVMELEINPKLSLADCEDHIKGFQEQLKEINDNSIVTTIISPLDQ